MSLPIVQTPVYTIRIPSIDKDVKIRPFLVREEKSLLIAQQSEDITVMIDTLKQVCKSCIKEDIDIDSLAIFDLEYIFTQLRSRSVGEFVELYFPCDTCDDPRAKAKIIIDISKISVQKNPAHSKNISLYNDVGIMMKYPNIKSLATLEKIKSGDVESIFDIVVDSIEHIYTNDEVFTAKEQSKEELKEFLNSLTQEQFKKIEQFFETMPKLSQDVSYSCPVCSKAHTKVLEGVETFF